MVLSCLILVGTACKSAEERCHEAQVEAQHAWDDYLAALNARNAVVTAAQAKAKNATREISKKIDAIASEETHRLYDPGAAWQRHYQVAFTQACRRDPVCADLEKDTARVNGEAATIEKRIALASEARDQALLDAADAWTAAKAVETEADVETSRAAERTAIDAADICGVPHQ